MKKILNSGTLAIMVLGLGPIALLFWAAGVNGSTLFILWIIAGIVIKFAMGGKDN